MNRDEFNEFCSRLPATSHVIQWGGSEVWKVGGKVFAICGGSDNRLPGITFKTSQGAYEMLREMPGLRPAPYLASRGLKWIQRYDHPVSLMMNCGTISPNLIRSSHQISRVKSVLNSGYNLT